MNVMVYRGITILTLSLEYSGKERKRGGGRRKKDEMESQGDTEKLKNAARLNIQSRVNKHEIINSKLQQPNQNKLFQLTITCYNWAPETILGAFTNR